MFIVLVPVNDYFCFEAVKKSQGQSYYIFTILFLQTEAPLSLAISY
jgi:hypothetical protein